jgi:L-asparaginase
MKTLLLIGTGGTIAGAAPTASQTIGYRAGVLSVAQLVDAVPGLADLAAIRMLQPFAIGSQHMRSAYWLELAKLVRNAQADDEVAGIVITHGTDTMEETAFFLDLVVARGKPVVMTGAMRPATAVGADGPANLLAACRFALDTGAAGRGVLVAFNDRLFAAANVGKVHTTQVDAFAARDAAAVGMLVSETVFWREPAADGSAWPQTFTTRALPDALPAVALVWQHVDCDESIVDWHVARGVRGIVVAGTGNGMLPDPMRAALAQASRRGCLVVRASRVASGPVVRNAEAEPADQDDALGFIASGFVAPLKARLLLQCCLVAGLTADEVQRRFDAFR